MLNERVRVSGNYVRLGEVFRHVGDQADVVVAYAPMPGKSAVFDAQWLYNVARRYAIPWRPISLLDRVIVDRESQVIDREQIEDEILAAFMDKGLDGDLQVQSSNRMLRIHVAGGAVATVRVDELTHDPRTGRFTALMTAFADDVTAQTVRVTGRAYEIARVPVLARPIGQNQVIERGDVEWIEVRADRVQYDTVLDADELVGKVARRTFGPGKPVRASDVGRPVVVKKGSLVTMVLKSPGLLLTARGRALEDGSKGDTIRITNTSSNTALEARVIGAGKVSVDPAARMAIN
jgi:flagella basal body P-ring formation protein FlgA